MNCTWNTDETQAPTDVHGLPSGEALGFVVGNPVI